MNRMILLAGAAALSLSLAACGKPAEDTDMAASPPPVAVAPVTVPAAGESTSPDFVGRAADSDMFEIESSKVALERTKNAEVKAFAQMMIEMHTRTSADLKQAVADSGLAITPPPTLPDDKQAIIASLKATDAAGFDKAYMDAQIDGHQATLDLMTRYSQTGDNAVLKAAATKTAPIVQEHLTKAKAIRDALM